MIWGINHLPQSEPSWFGQRWVICYNSLYNAVSQKSDLNFKINTKIKSSQNRKQKWKWTESELPVYNLKCVTSVLNWDMLKRCLFSVCHICESPVTIWTSKVRTKIGDFLLFILCCGSSMEYFSLQNRHQNQNSSKLEIKMKKWLNPNSLPNLKYEK